MFWEVLVGMVLVVWILVYVVGPGLLTTLKWFARRAETRRRQRTEQKNITGRIANRMKAMSPRGRNIWVDSDVMLGVVDVIDGNDKNGEWFMVISISPSDNPAMFINMGGHEIHYPSTSEESIKELIDLAEKFLSNYLGKEKTC